MSGYFFFSLRILFAIFLLLFFAWGIWVIWSDLKQQTLKVSKISVPAIVLSPEIDPEHSFRFNIPEIIIGRDDSCNLKVDEPTISARHARLSFHHNQWWIEDLNSSNGTYINNEPVATSVVVTSKDQIRLGGFIYLIDLD